VTDERKKELDNIIEDIKQQCIDSWYFEDRYEKQVEFLIKDGEEMEYVF
jgi:hypothetical protein